MWNSYVMLFPNSFFSAAIAIGLLVLAAVCGLVIVRRLFNTAELVEHHSVTDPLLQVVGMMFAILLGFMCGDAMQRFAQARTIVQQEAAAVADVFRLADGFADEHKNKIRKLCVQYVDQTIEDEWPKMAQKKTSNAVWKTYDELWQTLTRLKVRDDSEACVLQTILPSMVSLGDNRRMRVEALHNGLPPALWMVLGIAGLATVFFTFFFGSENPRLQMAMTALIALVIGLNIFMLLAYDDPFSGDVVIQPDAFIVDQRSFKMVLGKDEAYEKD